MEYEESTKEQWSVACPSCGKLQPYSWPQIRFDSVAMECVHCKEQHAEVEWKSRPGQWIARNPEATKRGFHLNALASSWEKWSRIIEEFKLLSVKVQRI